MADLYLLDYCRTTVQCRDAVIVQHLLVCIPEIVQGNLFKVAVGDLGTEDRCSVMISDRHTWRDSYEHLGISRDLLATFCLFPGYLNSAMH